jgi:hypothetical protein
MTPLFFGDDAGRPLKKCQPRADNARASVRFMAPPLRTARSARRLGDLMGCRPPIRGAGLAGAK